MQPQAQLRLMYIDDDTDDQMLFQTALKETAPEVQLILKESGTSALADLYATSHDAELPHLIVLDIYMPVFSGKQFCTLLDCENRFSKIPVAVFTNHLQDKDLRFFHSLGRPVYLKPSSFQELSHTLKLMLAHVPGQQL